jgi:hypothetical protein
MPAICSRTAARIASGGLSAIRFGRITFPFVRALHWSVKAFLRHARCREVR